MTTPIPWHTQTAEAACSTLQIDPAHGLSADAASQRLTDYGENRLVEAKPRPLWLKFLDQFKNFLVIVLLFAALLAWAVGDLKDAVVILIVVMLNAALGFYQEHRAEHGSVFNANFFRNGKLWLALAGVLALQVMAVHWQPAQAIFSTTDLLPGYWRLAIGSGGRFQRAADGRGAQTAVETAAYRAGKGSGKRALNPAQALQPLLALEVRRAIQPRPRPQPCTGAGR